jgi:ATP-binding cassette subfamily G (WHITE) protein 2 (PDR)
LIGFIFFGLAVYLASTEYISSKKSKGEVLLFPRGRVPNLGSKKLDEESNLEDRPNVDLVLSRERTVPDAPPSIQKQTAVFHWSSVNFDIKIKGGERRLLDDVDGWVKPGTLTALMVRYPIASRMIGIVLTHRYRAFQEQERQLFSMCLLAVRQWVS